MITIHKTKVKIDQTTQGVRLPLGARPLSVGMQHNEIPT